MMEIILKYFAGLTSGQQEKLSMLGPLYRDWNEKINLISRKDIDGLYEKHILHSLSIAKIIRFSGGTRILDVGTGGGFPGIPLAIMFPEVSFHLIDSIGKKINVVKSIAAALKLDNVEAEQIRVELVKAKYDFVVSRAVTQLPEFVKWTGKNVSKVQRNAMPNGILYLKGGIQEEEIKPFKHRICLFNLSDFFSEPWFETKKVIYIGV
jgi:16S rRNA (guanine527-N7)-methyltransferase